MRQLNGFVRHFHAGAGGGCIETGNGGIIPVSRYGAVQLLEHGLDLRMKHWRFGGVLRANVADLVGAAHGRAGETFDRGLLLAGGEQERGCQYGEDGQQDKAPPCH